MLSSLYALPFYDFDLRVSHARKLLPAALASVPFGFVLVRVRVRLAKWQMANGKWHCPLSKNFVTLVEVRPQR